LLVIDYCRHADEALRDAQADVWMGFEERELIEFATAAGLCAAKVQKLPSGFVQSSLDGHLTWQAMIAMRPSEKINPAAASQSSGGSTRRREK
jgi:ArsR family transcriptional regulator